MHRSSWTYRLSQLAQHHNSCKISLDGPYGDLSLKLTDYHTLFIIAGGIGITPFINLLDILCSERKYSNIKEVNLYWSYRESTLYDLFSEKLQKFADHSNVDSESVTEELCQNNPAITVNIYRTSSESADSSSPPSCFTFRNGRMDLEKIVRHEARVSTEKTALFVCGPSSMTRAVTKIAAAEGLEYHSEVFHY